MGRFKTAEERQRKIMAQKQNKRQFRQALRQPPVAIDFSKPQTDLQTEGKETK